MGELRRRRVARSRFRRCQRQKHSFYFWFDPEYVTSVKNSASDKSSASTGTKSAATLTRKPDVLNTLRRFLRRYMDDCKHTLVDEDVFDSVDSLYDRRTLFDGSQDGLDADGIYPSTSVGPGVGIGVGCAWRSGEVAGCNLRFRTHTHTAH